MPTWVARCGAAGTWVHGCLLAFDGPAGPGTACMWHAYHSRQQTAEQRCRVGTNKEKELGC